MNRQYSRLILCSSSILVLLAAYYAEGCTKAEPLVFHGRLEKEKSELGRSSWELFTTKFLTHVKNANYLGTLCNTLSALKLGVGMEFDFTLKCRLLKEDYASFLQWRFPEASVPPGVTALEVLDEVLNYTIANSIPEYLVNERLVYGNVGFSLWSGNKQLLARCSSTDAKGMDYDNVNELVVELEDLTSNPKTLMSEDIADSANKLQELIEGSGGKEIDGVRVVKIINNLMDADTRQMAHAEKTSGSAESILTSLEEYSLIANIKNNQPIESEDIKLQMWDLSEMSESISGFGHLREGQMINYDSTHIDDVDLSQIEAAIIMSDEAKQQIQKYHDNLEDQEREKLRMSFVLQKKANLFLTHEQIQSPESPSPVGSEIMALHLPAVYRKQLTGDIWAIFHPQKNKDGAPVCVYWDFKAGNWSTEGCSKRTSKQGRILCQCNHLTNFAILTNPTTYSKEHEKALSTITYIGLVVSSVGLLLTILTFLVFRTKLHFGHGQKVLANLAVALLGVNVVFLVGIKRTENEHVCVSMAALLHYLLLVAFAWMLVEAVLQYLRLVKVVGVHVERFMLKAALPSWTIPALLVIAFLCTQYFFKGYKLYRMTGGDDDDDGDGDGDDNKFCWLEEYPMYYGFMLPIGVVILINTGLYIRIVKSITCDRSENLRSTQSKSDLTKLQICGSLSVFVLLGLTWVFAFLTMKGGLLFNYVFCVLNSFQGFFVFLFHTFRNKQTREAWSKLLCPSRYKRRDEAKKQKKREYHEKQKGSSNSTIETGFRSFSYA